MIKASEVKRAVVVGAGTMGHSIAQVFAQAGITVHLVDLDEKLLDLLARLCAHYAGAGESGFAHCLILKLGWHSAPFGGLPARDRSSLRYWTSL